MPGDNLRLCLLPGSLREGNRVRLLRDGAEAYPRMREAIAKAEKSVLLEMYTFAEDSTGRSFARLLAEKAEAGVEVRVLYDAVGSKDSSREFFGRMRSRGVLVREFHPLWKMVRGLRYRRRNHRKLLVVDGRIGFVGGLNLSREYASKEEGGLGWRDTQVELEGPVVPDLADTFHELWRQRKDPASPVVDVKPREAGILVRALSSHQFRNRWSIGRSYRFALHHATRRIWIANAYFLPSAGFRRVLRKAVRRGVDVRILVPARSDVPPAQYASQRLYGRFLKWGLRIFEWPGPMMHAKTAVVDGAWSTVGSYNIDHLSLFHNYELTANIADAGFGRRMEEMFEQDFGQSRELRLDEWKRRGWGRKFLEDFWYTFRGFL